MFSIGPSEVIALMALLVAVANTMFKNSKGQSKTEEEMKIAIAKMTVLIQTMSKDIKEIKESISETEASLQGEVVKLQKRNSDSHSKIHEKIDGLALRVTELEQECKLIMDRIGQ